MLPDGWTLTPDIGGALYGKYMRDTILFSITVSQIGFVAAYTIFIAENLQALLLSVSDCKWNVPIGTLIFGQLLLFLPLAMIRNLAKLSGTALVADAFILVGRKSFVLRRALTVQSFTSHRARSTRSSPRVLPTLCCSIATTSRC